MNDRTLGARVRPLVCRTGPCLPGILLLLLFAIADATPLEPLHLKGLQDGGDYDSLIQPHVLSLTALPHAADPILTPLGPGPVRVTAPVPAVPPVPDIRAAESRAPPLP